MKKNFIVKILISVAVIALILLGCFLLFKRLGLTDLTREELQDYISSKGALAPIIFIIVSFLQVTFIPIPGAVTIIAGSFLFGFLESFIYSYIGMMVGAIVAFELGRLVGRPYVNWVTGDIKKADEWIKRLKGKEKVFLFFAFLLPMFPDDLLCSIAGVLPIKRKTFILMQVFTRATSILATLIFMSGEIIPYKGWGLIVLSILAILSIIAFVLSMKYSEKLNTWFDNFTEKFLSLFRKEKKENTTNNNK